MLYFIRKNVRSGDAACSPVIFYTSINYNIKTVYKHTIITAIKYNNVN